MKKYINGKIYSKNFKFEMGSFIVDDSGKFSNVTFDVFNKNIFDDKDYEIIDLKGKKVIPGLIDIHTHGAMGFDFSNSKLWSTDLKNIAINYYKNNGIKNFLATTMTLPSDELREVLKNDISLGFYLEGPFISKVKKGAQNELYIKDVDVDYFIKLYNESNNKIKVVTIAPEKKDAMLFIEKASKLCRVSVAHTDADYETTKKAFEKGATGITHLFNAMNGIHHRKPGPIIAAIENKNVFAEIICDGYHVDKAMIRFAFNNFGKERMILISDSLYCLGLNDGKYNIAGKECVLSDNLVKLVDGTIAGSATNLYKCMKNAIDFGIDENDAIRAATYNPAKYIGVLDRFGTIEDGKVADFIIEE